MSQGDFRETLKSSRLLFTWPSHKDEKSERLFFNKGVFVL